VGADTEDCVLVEMGVGVRSGMLVTGIKFGSGDNTAAGPGSRSDAVEQPAVCIIRNKKTSCFIRLICIWHQINPVHFKCSFQLLSITIYHPGHTTMIVDVDWSDVLLYLDGDILPYVFIKLLRYYSY
jgi:hypothetical protein